MSTKTLFRQLVDYLAKSRERKRRHRQRPRKMVVELLEDRCLLAGITTVVPDLDLQGAEDLLVPQALEAAATPPAPNNGTQTPPDDGAQTLPDNGAQAPSDGGGMTIEQTLSDEAQRNTIAFDGLAFLTGSLGADSFLPPGKVADFWGFQYLRDNDPSEMGHNTDFLTKAANNVLSVLTDSQIAELVTLAESQIDAINQYAYDRFVLMDGFRRLLEGDLPEGSTGLDIEAVKAYSAQLYALDAQISIERAEVMGGILHAMDATQREHLDAMVGHGMTSWPDVDDQLDPQAYSHDVHVAVMTYAGDMFSWYAGSVEADVYFCPERQGTYFGSFYLKDAPAMGNPDYTIDSNLTAESGAAFLATLTAEQARLVTELVDIQRDALNEIVEVRELVATELRGYMTGDTVDTDAVLVLMEQYGELDGEIIYQYANAFTAVGQSLTAEQEAALADLRAELGVSQPDGAYLYSEPIAMPTIVSSDFLFAGTIDDTQPPPDDGTQPPPEPQPEPQPEPVPSDDHVDQVGSDATQIVMSDGFGMANGTINQPADNDVFQFEMDQAGTAYVELFSPDGNLDTQLRVYDADGRIVSDNNDSHGGTDSSVILELDSGTYYVTASSHAQSSTGDYSIDVYVRSSDGEVITMADDIGVHRGSSFYLDANDSTKWDEDDIFARFGNDTDRSISGDWDGDDYDEIGIHRQGSFYLDVNGNGQWDGISGGDDVRSFGSANDAAAIGDWNGDGIDDIGVHRDGKFYCDANGNGKWDGTAGGDEVHGFGNPTDIAAIGDWNGDGRDNIGVFRVGYYYLDANGDGQWNGKSVDWAFAFGGADDRPITGDWNADGFDDVGVQRGNAYYTDTSGNRQWNGTAGGDELHHFGNDGDVALIGNWATLRHQESPAIASALADAATRASLPVALITPEQPDDGPSDDVPVDNEPVDCEIDDPWFGDDELDDGMIDDETGSNRLHLDRASQFCVGQRTDEVLPGTICHLLDQFPKIWTH